MNKKQRILTIIALAVFLTIAVLHYLPEGRTYFGCIPSVDFSTHDFHSFPYRGYVVVRDVKMPWFILLVTYGAFYAVLISKREKTTE